MRVRGFLLVVGGASLVFLVACGGGGEQSTPSASAEDGGEVTAEQAIERVLEMLEAAPDQSADASTATAERMKDCETDDVMRWEGRQWGGPPENPSQKPAWLVKVRGEFSGSIGYGLTPDPSPPRAGRFVQVLGDGGAGAILYDERKEGPELSRDGILERALDEMGISTENDPDPSNATVTLTTFREALATLRQEGAPQGFSEREGPDSPAWLFEVRGQFIGLCPGPLRPGRYFVVLALDGFVESSGFIPYATPTP